jgi:PAS domain S-box-containing protein
MTLSVDSRDITERKRAEEALGASAEGFRRYFDLGLIGMAITSPTKGCIEVNDRLCEMLGFERAELLQKTWTEMTHPDDLATEVVQFDRVMAGESDGYTIDKRWIRKDGRIIDTTISVKCVRANDGSVEYFVALLQDVTERNRAEQALRESEERYRSLISQVKEFAIFSTDERGIVTTWNEGCELVLGYAQRRFVGLDSSELFTPEDRAEGVPDTERRQAAETGTVRLDRWMMGRGGRRFFGMGATAALRDPAGQLIGYSTVIRDLTQMKVVQDELAQHGETLERLVTERTDELEKTTERLRLSERMASLGTLAAGLGHDMGNLLLPLDIRLDLLLQADLPADLHEHVLGIQKCARYLQRLSGGLRLLATDPLATPSRERTELGTWWNDVGMILKDVLPRGIQLEQDLPREECWVAMGRTGLTQVVFNLVQNAADAMKDRSQGHVGITVLTDPEAGRVTVRVTDDGPGMTDEVVRRCMEPYFSTKARGESTGMGLAFVHGLVKGSGGRVVIESRLGQGTSVSLELPRPQGPRAAILPKGKVKRPRGSRASAP